MTLPTDYEFGVLAAGSNEGTNILGSANPVTVTAAVDTNGRRMISQFGVEGCTGVIWQWLSESSYRFDNTTSADTGYTAIPHTHNVTVTGDAGTFTSANSTPSDIAPGWSWKNKTGGKGQLYTQGTYGYVKARAGGRWNEATNCGTLSRDQQFPPFAAYSGCSLRLITPSIEK